MANVKISQLTEQTTAADNDVVAGVSAASAGTVKTKLSTIATYLAGKSQTLTNKTLTSPVINTGVSGTAIDTDGTLAANSDTKLASQKAVKTYSDNISYGMARQAIMNGNFDVWQRGTSIGITNNTSTFLADRWCNYINADGGTLPIIAMAKQSTGSSISNSSYCSTISTAGAGTSLGVNSYGVYFQRIENGNRNLCGLNKKITVSFWAKSTIANKRICLSAQQNYGTGGSPSANEYILGTPITLTSTWTKYAVTFTTNTLVGKTFGTNGDDYVGILINYMWGTTIGNAQVSAGVTAETLVGAGDISFAQVQLCSGDVALPFQPKSFEEELRACQRYYESANAPIRRSNASPVWANSFPEGCYIPFKVTKRSTPLYVVNNTSSHTVNVEASTYGLNCYPSSGGTGNWYLYITSYTADSEI